jgi:hypothetical protein
VKEKLFGRGRRGGVLIIAGAVLGAAVAGPGATIAQKAMNLTTTTADKRYVKRSEVPATGAVVETPLVVNQTAFTPIANATIKAPGPGTLVVHGSLSAKDRAAGGADTKLQYRLTAGGTPLSATPTSFELYLPDGIDARHNGSVDGIAKVARKGPIEVQLQAQMTAGGDGAEVLGRSVTAQFVPKAKVAGKKGKKKTGGGGGGNVGP